MKLKKVTVKKEGADTGLNPADGAALFDGNKALHIA